MEKYYVNLVDMYTDRNLVIQMAESHREHLLKTFLMIGYAQFAGLGKDVFSSRRINVKKSGLSAFFT